MNHQPAVPVKLIKLPPFCAVGQRALTTAPSCITLFEICKKEKYLRIINVGQLGAKLFRF